MTCDRSLILNQPISFDQFRTAMMTQRSNTATRVRTQAGSQIFKCEATDLKTAEKRYRTFKGKIGWREFEEDGKKVVVYDLWNVDILHRDFGGSFDINTVFLNPVLMRVSTS